VYPEPGIWSLITRPFSSYHGHLFPPGRWRDNQSRFRSSFDMSEQWSHKSSLGSKPKTHSTQIHGRVGWGGQRPLICGRVVGTRRREGTRGLGSTRLPPPLDSGTRQLRRASGLESFSCHGRGGEQRASRLFREPEINFQKIQVTASSKL
jgi:hypothetical protein